MLEFYSHRVQIFRGRDRTTAATGTGTATTATGPGTATTCNTSKYLTHSLNLKTREKNKGSTEKKIRGRR